MSCTPTGNDSESPHGTFSPGRPAMHDGIVSRSLRYIASGFADSRVRARRRRSEQDVEALERRGVLADQHGAHLLRLAVVRVVVAGRQRVRADEDAPLRLVAEALVTRVLVHVETIARARRAVAVTHAVV